MRRTIFSSIDRVIAEIRKKFQQWKNLAQKYNFLISVVILGVDQLNLDHVSQDINRKEFQLERARLQAFITVTDSDCTKELMKSGSLGLLNYIIESKLEDGLPNIIIMLMIFSTSAFINSNCERNFSKLMLIKNYLRSTISNLAILAIERHSY